MADRRPSALLGALFVASFVLAGCGGGGANDAGAGPSSQGAGGGVGGASGATSGGGNANGGHAGASGGQAGTSGGHAGASGQAGHAGASGAQGGTSSGGAGHGGAAGGGGSSGHAGTSGAGGATTGCAKDADCAAQAPPTIPAGCAVGKCDATSKSCVFSAKDADGDGHATSTCKATDGTPIVLGDDCDDGDKTVHPGAWDGPAGTSALCPQSDGKCPDSCDGIDEDCQGGADQAKLTDGTSCTCTPNDVRTCSTDSAGQPITWPTGTPTGTCKYGAQTCLMNGTWGPCTGAVVPATEECNHLDDDCNGVVDDGPPPDAVPVDAIYYVYDGDDDGHAGLKALGYQKVHVCPFAIPTMAPAACTMLPLPCPMGTTVDACCPANGWKVASGIPQDDCDDRNPSAFPTAPENCATAADDNCDGNVNEGCACQPGTPASCSATPQGAPITWPAGVPVGTCKYGTAVCNGNGQFGQCNGAIAPAPMDDCAVPGDDSNCNGTPNDGCACIDSVTDPSYQASCSELPDGTPISWPLGAPVGSCGYGTKTCDPTGHYGQCNGATAPKAKDDCSIAGNDDNCNGVPNEGCPCIDSPGDPTYTTTCSALPDGTPITWPAGLPVGSCKYGTATCTPSGTYGQCNGAVAPLPADNCTVPGNDDDCNGVPNDGCVCLDVAGDPSYQANCSATPQGQPISWPGGAPQGACKYGTATCTQNGTYGQCIGAISPAGADSCTTAGDDSNCNGTPNDGCACIDDVSSPTYTANCSELSDGTPITWPQGAPVGACQYGTKTCTQSGVYGACQNAVAPKAADDCTGAMGIDSNCDGIVSCKCQAGTLSTAVCNQNGSCAGSQAQCKPDGSGYYPCTLLPKSQDTCDPGNDDTCNGVPNEGCAHLNGQGCGATSTCNPDGVWQSCTPNGGCACSITPSSPPAGSVCNYGSGLGACASGGYEVCTSTDSGAVSCSQPRDANIGTSSYITGGTTWNGSFDWDCNGSISQSPASGLYPDTNGNTDPNACLSDGLNGGFQAVCQKWNGNSGSCTSGVINPKRYLCEFINPLFPPSNNCGYWYYPFGCSYNSSNGTCNYASHSSPAQVGCH